MIALFRLILALAGAAICLVASLNILIGLQATAEVFEALLTRITGTSSGFDGLSGRDADSELRFYATFFLAYGLGVLWLALRFPRHHQTIPAMLALFLAAGLARGLSWLTVGAPHTLFQILLWIELVMPPLLWLFYKQILSGKKARPE